ncbi:X-ray radiation resistance-associated protein 1 isoform X2 [Dendropsophus ebraccatus]|uniref:X-ray radiation resistance-associated protein 1 isoform X2 n=1 Tax=Dendropsophus ebraccatus TaxID=150705 RepID=UPI0038318DFB
MDADPLYITDYFPARSLFRAKNGGAGHWRVAQRSGFRTVVRSASSEQKMAADSREVARPTLRCQSNKMEDRGERVLDTPFLVRTHHVKRPSDLCAADVSDRRLTSAQWEEFQQFTCLAYINASENLLPLESFQTFPALRELDLSMNGIHRITVIPGEFPHLEVLDLSYNSLSPGDILQLGVLPRLRVLCLTGNGLTHLPRDLSAPPRSKEDRHIFPSLEVLMLDENLLSHPDVFVSLAGLQRLRLLNLDKNAISAIPDLSGAVVSPAMRQTGPGGAMAGRGHLTDEAVMEQSNTAEDRMHYMVLRSTTDPDRTEVIFPSPRNPPDRAMKPLDIAAIPPSSLPEPLLSPTGSPPLPSLRTLSLADNKITREEDVLPVALFPSLEELIIYGNPLTTLRKGLPPLLGSFLQQRLGITVTHRKSPVSDRPHLIIPRRERRKVTTHVPKIPKQPLMLESLLSPFLRLPHLQSDVTESVMSSSPLPPIRTSSERGTDSPPGRSQESTESPRTSEEEMSFGSDPDVESVFMTQVENIPDAPGKPLHIPSPAPEEQDTDREGQPKKIPEKFRGYEELYDVTADPTFIEPVGIQNNVRALEYALRRLMVYKDYKPRLHSIQKPYIPRESKLGADISRSPRRSKQEIVMEVLSSMKERRAVVETPLDSVLQEGKSRKEHKEAKLLLKEIQEKYKLCHQEAVKRASEVEADLRDTARQLLQAQRRAGDAGGRSRERSRDLQPAGGGRV